MMKQATLLLVILLILLMSLDSYAERSGSGHTQIIMPCKAEFGYWRVTADNLLNYEAFAEITELSDLDLFDLYASRYSDKLSDINSLLRDNSVRYDFNVTESAGQIEVTSDKFSATINKISIITKKQIPVSCTSTLEGTIKNIKNEGYLRNFSTSSFPEKEFISDFIVEAEIAQFNSWYGIAEQRVVFVNIPYDLNELASQDERGWQRIDAFNPWFSYIDNYFRYKEGFIKSGQNPELLFILKYELYRGGDPSSPDDITYFIHIGSEDNFPQELIEKIQQFIILPQVAFSFHQKSNELANDCAPFSFLLELDSNYTNNTVNSTKEQRRDYIKQHILLAIPEKKDKCKADIETLEKLAQGLRNLQSKHEEAIKADLLEAYISESFQGVSKYFLKYVDDSMERSKSGLNELTATETAYNDLKSDLEYERGVELTNFWGIVGYSMAALAIAATVLYAYLANRETKKEIEKVVDKLNTKTTDIKRHITRRINESRNKKKQGSKK